MLEVVRDNREMMHRAERGRILVLEREQRVKARLAIKSDLIPGAALIATRCHDRRLVDTATPPITSAAATALFDPSRSPSITCASTMPTSGWMNT